MADPFPTSHAAAVPPAAPPVEPSGPVATRFDSEGNAIPDEPFYCPACGKRSPIERVCEGQCEARPGIREPVRFAPTAELAGDPSGHTPAPSSE